MRSDKIRLGQMRYDNDILGLVKRLDDRVKQILDDGWNMTNDRIISK